MYMPCVFENNKNAVINNTFCKSVSRSEIRFISALANMHVHFFTRLRLKRIISLRLTELQSDRVQ